MNILCDRLNLLDFNKWSCLILLCGAIKLIIIIIIIISSSSSSSSSSMVY